MTLRIEGGGGSTSPRFLFFVRSVTKISALITRGITNLNVLPIFPLLFPKLLRLLPIQPALGHGYVNQRLPYTFSHALTTPTHKHPPIDRIHNIPHNIGLVPHFILHIPRLTLVHPRFARLYNVLDIPFVRAQLARINLIKRGISHSLHKPNLVRAVGI